MIHAKCCSKRLRIKNAPGGAFFVAGRSEQAADVAVFINIDVVGSGRFRQPRHFHDGAGDGDDKSRTGGNLHFADVQREALRAAERFRVVRERVLGFRHADGQVAVAQFFQILQGLARFVAERNVRRAVEFLRDGADFFHERQVVRIKRGAAACTLFAGVDDCAGERFAAFTAMRPHFAQGDFHAAFGTGFFDERQFGIAVALEAVDGDDDRQAEYVFQVGNVAQQVGQALFQGLDVFFAQVFFRHAAVVFQGADGGDDHGRIGFQAGQAAFDVAEFFRAQIRAEARFGNGIIGQMQGEAGGGNGIAAVGDVGEWAAVDEGGRAAYGLHQIRLDGVFQKCGHRAVGVQVFSVNGATVFGVGNQDVAQTVFQVGQVFGQTEYGHDFGCHGDVEAVGTQHAVGRLAVAADDVAQLAVVHVHRAPPQHAFGVDVQRVALIDVVVEHGGKQIVGRADGVEVAGEVQVDVFHRQNLRITAARRAALDAEHGAQRRFAHGDHGLFADVVQCVGQADGYRGLAFARRGRIDGGYQNQTAFPVGQGKGFGGIDFRFVVAVWLKLVLADAQLGGNFAYRADGGFAGDFGIGFETHGILAFQRVGMGRIISEAV